MKKQESVRVRFAPAPSGRMHLGNLRTALINYLFAKKHDGAFIVRIEDTDPNRVFDPGAKHLLKDLSWVDLAYNEGPNIGGPYAPYFQSERTAEYQKKLDYLYHKDLVYRCFCTPKELEKKKIRQQALKQPPRYDRRCRNLSSDAIAILLAKKTPFIWRMKLDNTKKVSLPELFRGKINFELKHFSDFPITRRDGSFTYLFANCVDDITMKITHVLRGQDHLSNTASQLVLYQAFNEKSPIFWHLPVLCNEHGKKLSKRDFGFTLNDLKKAGYLPEAIVNYLGIIGGGKFDQEIFSLPQLTQAITINSMDSTSHIRYDIEKLNWINRQWIKKLPIETLTLRCLPFIQQFYKESSHIPLHVMERLVHGIRNELITLADSKALLQFYFDPPSIDPDLFAPYFSIEQLKELAHYIKADISNIIKPDQFLKKLRSTIQSSNILSTKHLYQFLRICLTGVIDGPSVVDLISMLGTEKAHARIDYALNLFL